MSSSPQTSDKKTAKLVKLIAATQVCMFTTVDAEPARLVRLLGERPHRGEHGYVGDQDLGGVRQRSPRLDCPRLVARVQDSRWSSLPAPE